MKVPTMRIPTTRRLVETSKRAATSRGGVHPSGCGRSGGLRPSRSRDGSEVRAAEGGRRSGLYPPRSRTRGNDP